ncbi:MAG: helix-turn-helix domain-containing protein [Planctomycetaceae bacterium]|nr:helix-turn-helix domain-containing protein [Planctomycetaceae bacterium]
MPQFSVDAVRIIRLREQLGLSQAELARRAGLHRNTIVKLEAGKGYRPAVKTIQQIANALSVDPADITLGDDHRFEFSVSYEDSTDLEKKVCVLAEHGFELKTESPDDRSPTELRRTKTLSGTLPGVSPDELRRRLPESYRRDVRLVGHFVATRSTATKQWTLCALAVILPVAFFLERTLLPPHRPTVLHGPEIIAVATVNGHGEVRYQSGFDAIYPYVDAAGTPHIRFHLPTNLPPHSYTVSATSHTDAVVWITKKEDNWFEVRQTEIKGTPISLDIDIVVTQIDSRTTSPSGSSQR